MRHFFRPKILFEYGQASMGLDYIRAGLVAVRIPVEWNEPFNSGQT